MAVFFLWPSAGEVSPQEMLPSLHRKRLSLNDREIIVLVGKTGMGKTTWTKDYLARQRRVLVLDPQREYADALHFDDLADLVDHVGEYRTFRCATEWPDDLDFLCQLALSVGNVYLVVDEAQRVIPPRGELSPWLAHVIYRGRHRGVSLVVIAQRPTTVHIAARSQWTRLVSFRQTEGADCRWTEDQIGETADLADLDVLEYVEATPAGATRKRLHPPWARGRKIDSPGALHDASARKDDPV